MKKTTRPKKINQDNQKRCGREGCAHMSILHGNGSKAHNLSTVCIIAGCDCEKFVEVTVYREPRVSIPKTLDRTEPRLFDASALGL